MPLVYRASSPRRDQEHHVNEIRQEVISEQRVIRNLYEPEDHAVTPSAVGRDSRVTVGEPSESRIGRATRARRQRAVPVLESAEFRPNVQVLGLRQS